MLHYTFLILDLVIVSGICISTFYITNRWQGDTAAPDVWAHINWTYHIATTGSHNYSYMPGLHILIWLVSEIFGCSVYTAGVNLPVFLGIYFALATYFAGAWVFNRTTGLMLMLVYMTSPVLLSYHSTLLLPRNLAHGLFILGLLFTVRAMASGMKKHVSSLAAGVAIGAMVGVHLAYDEVFGCASLILTLIIIVAINRKRIAHAGIVVFTALLIFAPYIAKLIYHKIQSTSYFNMSTDRLIVFNTGYLYERIFPAIVWVGLASFTVFMLLWMNWSRLSFLRILRLSKPISVAGTRMMRTATVLLVWAIMAVSSFVLLLCVGRETIEAFVYGTLPLPHPVNTEHFFTMLGFGLLGSTGMIGYLPACLRGKWKLPAIVVVVLVFALILALSQIMVENDARGGFVLAKSIPMWSLLVLAVLLADYRSCILSKVKNSKLITAFAIITISVVAVISMPSSQPIKRFVLKAPRLDAKPTLVEQQIIHFSTKDAVIVSAWPYLDSLEYLLGRRVEDGLLGPGALWTVHRGQMPGKYWHTLKFAKDRITNTPEQIVEALHADFGPRVYLYFRAESIRAFATHKRISKELTPYTSQASQEIFGDPPVTNPRERFINMIRYFQAYPQYFRKIDQDDRSVLFKLIK